MKKIGILTFHRALNYGGILQCFALAKALEGKQFYVEVIDYRPGYIERYRRILYFDSSISLYCNIKNIIWRILNYRWIRKSCSSFDTMLNELNVSPVVSNNLDIKSFDYDFIIFGSDQIWNTRITKGYDKVFWGEFEHASSRFISYAASIGHDNFDEINRDRVKQLRSNFEYIAVRELDFARFLNSFGLKCTHVVDPTILANPSIFNKIALKPPIDNYILVYALKSEDKAVEFALSLANQLSATVLVLCAYKYKHLYKDKKVKIVECITPQQFLGYIRYSILNVCISFHGTVLSTIFHKNFYALKDDSQSRYSQYLDQVGLSDRLIGSDDDIIYSNVDYSCFDNRLDLLRNESNIFINNALM